MNEILIDSSAFLAMLDARDKFHTEAATFIIAHPETTWLIPEPIFSETMTLIKSRLGANAAIQLGESIRQSGRFQQVPFDETDRGNLWQIFSQYDDKAWSYADCAFLVAGRRLQLYQVFSFDHHIDQMAELTRLP